MLALSVRQPWAWAILCAGKDIENRSWSTRQRGRVFIHAAKSALRDEYEEAAAFIAERSAIAVPRRAAIPRGMLIGSVEIVDCVSASDSPWFVGPFGFVLRNPELIEPVPCVGRLGFFEPEGVR